MTDTPEIYCHTARQMRAKIRQLERKLADAGQEYYYHSECCETCAQEVSFAQALENKLWSRRRKGYANPIDDDVEGGPP